MGLIRTIGKVATSKILDKAIDKAEEQLKKKQNRDQTIKYCTYIRDNITRIRTSLEDLQYETVVVMSMPLIADRVIRLIT